MNNKRHMQILFEAHEVMIIRAPKQKAFCEFCQAEVAMLSPDAAAAVFQSSARCIFRSVEAGELHFLETATGSLLVCRNSLVGWKQK